MRERVWCPVHDEEHRRPPCIRLVCAECHQHHVAPNAGQLPSLCTACTAKHAEEARSAVTTSRPPVPASRTSARTGDQGAVDDVDEGSRR